MTLFRKLVTTLLLTATILTTCAIAQSNLTQIRDTIYNADGTPFNGTVVITWNGYSTTVSGTVSPLSTSARIYNGALSVLLVPTTTAAAGSYYQVVYSSSNGTVMWTETWQVPPSSNPLSVSGVRTSSSTTTGGSGSTGGTTTGGTGSGSTQYATLPIAMSQVTGLTSALNTVTTNVNTLQSSVSALQTTMTNPLATVVFVDDETPAGTVNGTNAAFTLTAAPSPAASLELYRNGVMQRAGVDYTLSGSSVTFASSSAPRSGDVLIAYYRKTGTGSAVTFADAETPGGAINGTNATFTLSAAPNPSASLQLTKNGMLLTQGADYTLSGSTVTFATSAVPAVGDSLLATYRH